MGENKSPILNIGHTRWVFLRVLNIRVVNASLGNLEAKVDQYFRPTVDVRCLCSGSVYVLGSDMIFSPKTLTISLLVITPPILHTCVSPGGWTVCTLEPGVPKRCVMTPPDNKIIKKSAVSLISKLSAAMIWQTLSCIRTAVLKP